MEQFYKKARVPLRMALVTLLLSFLSHSAYADNIAYLDGDGVQHTADATPLTGTMLAGLSKTNPLGAGWYYVSDTITVSNNIPIKSDLVNSTPTDVHIILTNRALLNVNGVIYKHWNYANGALWIHSQTTDTLQMGALTVNNSSGIILGDTIEEEGYTYFEKYVDGSIQADSIVICGGSINVSGPGRTSDNFGIKSTVSDIFASNAKLTVSDVQVGITSARSVSASLSKVNVSSCFYGIFANGGALDIKESVIDITVQSLAMQSNVSTDSISIADSEVTTHSALGMLSNNAVVIRNSTMNLHTTYNGPFAIGANGKATIESSSISSANAGQYSLMCRGGSIKDCELDLNGGTFGINNNYGDISIINTNGTYHGNVYGINSSGKVAITNGTTESNGSIGGVHAGDSIVLNWTTDRETRIQASSYSCPSGKLVFRNTFGLLSDSEVATATNADDEVLCAAYPLHITSANAATYYEGHYDVQMSRALVASIVTIQIENNDTTLNFMPIAGGSYHSDILSANTPVMITRNPDFANDTTSTYAMIYYNYNEQLLNVYPENILKGSDVDTLTYGGDKYFRLMSAYGDIGWYPSSGYAPFHSPAHHAWLPLTNEQYNTIDSGTFILTTQLYSKKTFAFFESESEGEITGIDSAIEDSDSKADVWYDLNGRILQGRPEHSGVYINQGKKVIVQ